MHVKGRVDREEKCDVSRDEVVKCRQFDSNNVDNGKEMSL
jgi:hypothetical protein